jgi:hypothetical protein
MRLFGFASKMKERRNDVRFDILKPKRPAEAGPLLAA